MNDLEDLRIEIMTNELLVRLVKFFDAGGPIDHFNWGKSVLTARDIRELNEVPLQINRVLELRLNGKDGE